MFSNVNFFLQQIIEELDVAERLKKAVALTKRELNLSQLTRKIKEYIPLHNLKLTTNSISP